MKQRKIVHGIISFLLGALFLTSLSFFQKLSLGVNIFTLKAYSVPFFFGGTSGYLIGFFLFRIKENTNELIKANNHLQQKIIDNKQTEKMLRESEERLKTILETVLVGVMIVDTETKTIVEVNPAAEKIIGIQKSELIGKKCFKHICPMEEKSCPIIDLGEKIDNSERLLINVKGKELTILKTAVYVTLNGRKHLLESFMDITDRKQNEDVIKKINKELRKANEEIKNTQAQLIQTAKLASIGELSSGIAHELNQPLAFIRAIVQLALMENKFDLNEISNDYKKIEDCTTRMMKIIDHLRSFSRQVDTDYDTTNIYDILENSLILYNQQLSDYNILVKKEFVSDLPLVYGNDNQLEQVFMNLISNARDALEGKKDAALTIKTELISKTGGKNEINVHFIDNGTGILPSNLNKIFDPFFTTKEAGKGTGLGMSIAYGIIKNHEGDIKVSSVYGIGTTISVILPVKT